MATFAALSFQFRHVYYVVLVCVLLRGLQIALPSQLERYSANHEAWKQLHILNFTTQYYLNDSVIANASYTGTWDITHLIDEAREAKEAENPTTKTPIFSLLNAEQLLVSALTYVVSYYWNLFLERKLPARPRGNSPKETSEGVSEDAEEKVVKRWIAAGKVTRASLSGWNTFYKWVLDISVGRALIELTSQVAWIAIHRKDKVKSIKAAPLEILFGTLAHLPTPFTISSLLGMIVVPANQRVVFSTGFYFLCSMFFHVAVSFIFPQFLLTNAAKKMAKQFTEGAWLGALDRHEGKNSERLDSLFREL